MKHTSMTYRKNYNQPKVRFSLKKLLQTERSKSDALNEEIIELTQSCNDLKHGQEFITGRVDYQEDYNRRLNLRFSGVVDSNRYENWEQSEAVTLNIIKMKLGITSEIGVERAHRVGLWTEDGLETLSSDSLSSRIETRFSRKGIY